MRSMAKGALHAEPVPLVVNDDTHHDFSPSPFKDVMFLLTCAMQLWGEAKRSLRGAEPTHTRSISTSTQLLLQRLEQARRS